MWHTSLTIEVISIDQLISGLWERFGKAAAFPIVSRSGKEIYKDEGEFKSGLDEIYNQITGNLLTSFAEFINIVSPDVLPEFLHALSKKDGAATFAKELPEIYKPEQIVLDPTTRQAPNERRAWELIGLFYVNRGRHVEALPIYDALYRHLLIAQERIDDWTHKGMPLVWISDCYANMGYPAIAKRYLMLTLCEDAIIDKGIVPPETTGIYFRLVWGGGLSDQQFKRYAMKMYGIRKENPRDSLYPEWILQQLDQNWITGIPSANEAALYTANRKYIEYLVNQLGDNKGKYLEQLAEYLLACMPGCRTKRRIQSKSTDYDIVCSMEGFEVDFRSEMGRYFVCECKDLNSKASVSVIAKFCRVLDSIKSKFGILFSKKGITGTRKTTDAERELLKVYQDRGMVIIVIDEKDLERVSRGDNFINILRQKYEMMRLDLSKSNNEITYKEH